MFGADGCHIALGKERNRDVLFRCAAVVLMILLAGDAAMSADLRLDVEQANRLAALPMKCIEDRYRPISPKAQSTYASASPEKLPCSSVASA